LKILVKLFPYTEEIVTTFLRLHAINFTLGVSAWIACAFKPGNTELKWASSPAKQNCFLKFVTHTRGDACTLLWRLVDGCLARASRQLKFSKSLGLKQKVTPHMLRHTAATLLIEGGVDIRFVQRLLGHASISTTEIYTHVTDTALRSALERADVMRGFA
jgi:hypothetical protein